MKKLLQLTALTAFMLSTVFVSKSHAVDSTQNVVSITVPYQLTNLDPRITKFKVRCRIRAGMRSPTWGQGEKIIDITPPNANGRMVVNVRKTGNTALDSNMAYTCFPEVAMDPNDQYGFQEMETGSAYDFAKTPRGGDRRVSGRLQDQ